LRRGALAAVAVLNSPGDESGLHLSRDGLNLWLASTRSGGLGGHDIYVATRASRAAAFAAPVHVGEVSSAITESSPAISGDHRVLVLNVGSVPRELRESRRVSTSSPWSAPALIPELADAADDAAPELSPDALTLYFASSRAGGQGDIDLWITTRPSLELPFAPPAPLVELDTAARESTPWVSANGRVIYFASNRDGPMTIYRAER
jgi:hypothetical protein